MKYSEMIKLYKEGKLEEEQAKTVQRDIERQSAISDYLVDEMENGDWNFTMTDSKNDESDNSFTEQINRAIRRAFIKMGIRIAAAILVILLFCMYGLSPIVSALYYNPAEKISITNKDEGFISTQSTNQMSLDWSVYSELNQPGNRRDGIDVEKLGFGEYSFVVWQTSSYNDMFHNVSGKVSRGKVFLYDDSITGSFPSNYFAYTRLDMNQSVSSQEKTNSHYSWSGFSTEEAKDALIELEPNKYYQAYVSFDKILDFDEMTAIMKANDLTPDWCGVVTNDDRKHVNIENTGFSMDTTGPGLFGWDEKKYPDLNVWTPGVSENLNTSVIVNKKVWQEKWCKTHFTSMLQYVIDHQELADTFNFPSEKAKTILEYISTHELEFYGVELNASGAELQKLEQDKMVYGIVTEPY